jgi:hypothetical protein
MTTVGYGNQEPTTSAGRAVACFTGYWGTFLLTLQILVITILFSPSEQKAIDII